jgi:hypothetical protein
MKRVGRIHAPSCPIQLELTCFTHDGEEITTDVKIVKMHNLGIL